MASYYRRKAIVKDVITKLKTISTANGFLTNMGAQVKYYHLQTIDPDKQTMLCDVQDKVLRSYEKQYVEKIIFEFKLGAATKDTTKDTLDDMVYDIEDCLNENLQFFKTKYGQFEYIIVDGDEPVLERSEKIYGEASVIVEVRHYIDPKYQFDERTYEV